MNFKLILSAILLAAIVWSGCNKAKELLDVEFDADFKVDLPVMLDGKSMSNTFLVEETVDPMADEEARKYSEKIKVWRVTSLSGIFLQVNPGFDLTDGLMRVSSESGEAIWQIDDQTISEGATITLGNENGQWQTLNQMLDAKEEFTVHFSGSSSGEENFILQLIIKTRVTANPL